jgi:predicted ArsR family transcriptional regulator
LATLKLEILEAALRLKIIRQLTKDEEIAFHPSVVTACAIVTAIAQDDLDLEQVSARAQVHPETAKQYLRWLEAKKLISTEPIEGSVNGKSKLYFKG